jgi:ankyrin repeat protein
MGAQASVAHRAAGGGDIEALADALRTTPDALNQRAGQEQYTPLHYAALFGQLDCVVLLVAKGAFLDARTIDRATPLYLAAGNGHLDVVRVLCENGADINLSNRQDHSPLMKALYRKHEAVAMDLVARGANLSTVTKFGDTAKSIAERFDLTLVAAAIRDAEAHPQHHADIFVHRVATTTPADASKKSAAGVDDDSEGSVDSTTGRRKLTSTEGTPSNSVEMTRLPNEPVNDDRDDLSLDAIAARMSASGDGTTCLVCMRNPADVLLLPCRHLCLCSDCHGGFDSMTKLRCPICRTPVVEHKPARVSGS